MAPTESFTARVFNFESFGRGGSHGRPLGQLSKLKLLARAETLKGGHFYGPEVEIFDLFETLLPDQVLTGSSHIYSLLHTFHL